MLANWIVPRKELIREPLADNRVAVAGETLLIGEEPSAKQRYLHGGEIAGITPAIEGVLLKLKTGRRTLGNGEEVIPAPARAGRPGDEAGGADPRQTAHALEKRLMESKDFLPGVVLFLRQPVPHGEHVAGDATQVRGTQVQKAFEE